MTKDIYAFTDDSEKVKIGTLEFGDTPKRVGGIVYYIDTSATGSYIFYDSNMNPISAPQEGDDYTNCYYVATDADKDKYYVYDNTTGIIIDQYWWGYNNITTGATSQALGGGKTNTASILAITDTSEYATGSIWELLKTNNTNAVNGCNDWYIGSEGDLEYLRYSQLNDWFYNYSVTSSSELTATKIYTWAYPEMLSKWSSTYKTYQLSFCFIRSF